MYELQKSPFVVFTGMVVFHDLRRHVDLKRHLIRHFDPLSLQLSYGL